MIFRIAKPSDLNRIVDIHYSTRSVNGYGIFAQMGKPFLKAYYKIVLSNKYSVFVCAEDDNGNVQGVAFAILNSEQFDTEVKQNKFRLAVGALSSIIVKPALLLSLFSRYRSLQKEDNKFVNNYGARGGFWGWNPDNKDSISSYELHERFLAIIHDLGVKELHFEVDKENKAVYRFHKINGAKEIEILKLPDGRERVMMSYDMDTHVSRVF